MALKENELRPIIENIEKNYNNIEEPLIEKVLQRLYSFGYTLKEDDSWMIAFCTQIVEKQIKNSCNILEIPDGLTEVTVDRICGEFLFSKKQSGKLDNEFDIEMAVKQVQTGDTNITFYVEGTETTEVRLNKLITYLKTKGEGDLICYRKMSW